MNASSDGVVACSMGAANFSMEASDSPSFSRSLVAASPSRRQDLLPALRLDLLARDGLAAGRAHRLQVDHVVAAEARDRPDQQRLDALSLGDLAREIPRHPLVRRPSHVAKSLPDAFLGDDVQERALSQLHRHGLPERPVEDLVAGRVGEVRDEDAVLVREGRGAAGCAGADEIERRRGRDAMTTGEQDKGQSAIAPARRVVAAPVADARSASRRRNGRGEYRRSRRMTRLPHARSHDAIGGRFAAGVSTAATKR